jgi:aspartate oxidase
MQEDSAMNSNEFDVIVAGGGLAGFQAAVTAAESGPKLRVALVTAASENAYGGCSFKTHGTNAAMNPDDSPERHARDTMDGGGGINNRELVDILTSQIPGEIHRMERRGIHFDKSTDGKYQAGYYGGSSTPRSIHKKDMAGRHMVDALTIEAQKLGVFLLCDRQIVQFPVGDDGCHGVTVINRQNGRIEAYSATNTISALGGGNCVYPTATISKDKTAAGIVQAYEAGAAIIDMEMTQFHPTGYHNPGGPGHGEILEEELRSLGAQFFNAEGERYMFRYDERGERATRDKVSRGTYIEIKQGRGTPAGGVTFDFSGIDRETLQSRFPFMMQRLRSFGVDMATCPTLPTSPSAHFLMGGIKIDGHARTSIERLLACGEDAGGIHGGNRLGGNGVADALVFGSIAGRIAASNTHSSKRRMIVPRSVRALVGLHEATLSGHIERLERTMWANAGPVRNRAGLLNAENEIGEIYDALRGYIVDLPANRLNATTIMGRIAVQKLILATMIVKSAQARENSVGAHFREDDDGTSAIYNVVLKQGHDRTPIVRRVFNEDPTHSAAA